MGINNTMINLTARRRMILRKVRNTLINMGVKYPDLDTENATPSLTAEIMLKEGVSRRVASDIIKEVRITL